MGKTQGGMSANLTPLSVAMQVSLTASTGPEGRQEIAHGVSRGAEGATLVISAPEGRQRLSREICRPFRGSEYNTAISPTAHAVGYFLAPLRGYRRPGT